MPSYVLAGLMGVTLFLPAGIAYLLHEIRDNMGGQVAVAGCVIGWLLAVGAAVTVWAASGVLYPEWWGSGDSAFVLVPFFGTVGNLIAMGVAMFD